MAKRKYPFRSANKPTTGQPVAGIAVLLDRHGLGHFYIKVTEDLVDRLARVMPQGLGPENQAYIQVTHRAGVYEVWCNYLDKSRQVLLFKQPDLPEWVKRVRYE
jgi:hypothetical protein